MISTGCYCGERGIMLPRRSAHGEFTEPPPRRLITRRHSRPAVPPMTTGGWNPFKVKPEYFVLLH
jgi:hypothetical protein